MTEETKTIIRIIKRSILFIVSLLEKWENGEKI